MITSEKKKFEIQNNLKLGPFWILKGPFDFHENAKDRNVKETPDTVQKERVPMNRHMQTVEDGGGGGRGDCRCSALNKHKYRTATSHTIKFMYYIHTDLS